MGVQAEGAFAGNRLQGAQRLKLGGRLLERAGGEALSLPTVGPLAALDHFGQQNRE